MRCNFFPNPNVGMQVMQSLLVLVIAQIKTLRKWYLANATSYGHWVHREFRNSCEALLQPLPRSGSALSCERN